MGRSRGTLTRKGRNGPASHALDATAPVFYSTRVRGYQTRSKEGAWQTAQPWCHALVNDSSAWYASVVSKHRSQPLVNAREMAPLAGST